VVPWRGVSGGRGGTERLRVGLRTSTGRPGSGQWQWQHGAAAAAAGWHGVSSIGRHYHRRNASSTESTRAGNTNNQPTDRRPRAQPPVKFHTPIPLGYSTGIGLCRARTIGVSLVAKAERKVQRQSPLEADDISCFIENRFIT